MPTRRCEHIAPVPHNLQRCRKRAQILLKYETIGVTKGDGKGIMAFCWTHYHEAEQNARQPNVHFRIVATVIYGPNANREAAHVQPEL